MMFRNRRQDNAVLLLGGSHHGDWYYDRFAILREGDGVSPRGGDRYEIARWPTGELVGIVKGATLAEPTERLADDISLPETTFQIARIVTEIGLGITRDIAIEVVKTPFRIGWSLLPF